MEIEFSKGKSLHIRLHGPSQDADPWYCIRCWEKIKLAKQSLDGVRGVRRNCDSVDEDFGKASLAVQALRLGVDPIFNKPSDRTLQTRS